MTLKYPDASPGTNKKHMLQTYSYSLVGTLAIDDSNVFRRNNITVINGPNV